MVITSPTHVALANILLARALAKEVEIGRAVPTTWYAAVAEVGHGVQDQEGRVMGRNIKGNAKDGLISQGGRRD